MGEGPMNESARIAPGHDFQTPLRPARPTFRPGSSDIQRIHCSSAFWGRFETDTKILARRATSNVSAPRFFSIVATVIIFLLFSPWGDLVLCLALLKATANNERVDRRHAP